MRGCRATLFLVVTAVLLGCGGGGTASPEDSRPRVVATTTIVGDLVRTVGGPEIRLQVLMGAGIDPHLYKASAGDVRRMSSAQAIFYNGLHLEGRMTEVLEQMGGRGARTIAVGECLPAGKLITSSGFSGIHDPHVWFDVGLWAVATGCVAEALAELDPPHADVFRKRGRTHLARLTALDRWVRERAEDLAPEERVLVTAHDAFAYFGRAYGFEVRGLLGVSTASEAGTSDVTELAAFIVERRIPAIFVETSVPPRYVEALEEAVNARGFAVEIGGSLYSDSLGNPGTPAGSYEGTVRANVGTIVSALAGDPEGE
ncbi:MAG: metal ABC transporter solute-binding protein, Zn/Mn family [Thermoanaerobaculales bacterium]